MPKMFQLTAMLLLTGVSLPAAAQNESKREIVVTARSLKDTEADLKACLARKCPPDQDIKATLAHAENVSTDCYSLVGRCQLAGGRAE